MAQSLSPKETRTRIIVDAVRSLQQAPASGLSNIVEDTTPQLGGALDGQGYDINGIGVVFLTEQAAAEADVAGQLQLWAKTATPNQFWWTDDAGNDRQGVYVGGAFHDGFSDFVANEHINHTSVTLTAGTGLTGGGDISANRSFAVTGVLEDLDAMGAPSADGEMVVATGVGATAWESGATLRTSIGVGTGDSPQFTGVELGHASDTTLTRVSAGVVAVEGTNLVKADATALQEQADAVWEAGTGTTPSIVAPDAIAAAIAALGGSGAGVDVQVFTSSGTWTKPGSGTMAYVRLWGGGGSGGNGGSGDAGAGGGGGAFNDLWIPLGSLGATETVTIGAGGASRTSEANGAAGGQTSFGALLTAYGGGGGGGSTSFTTSGGGGGGATAVGGNGSSSSTGASGGAGLLAAGATGTTGDGAVASWPGIDAGGAGGGVTANTGKDGGGAVRGGGGGGGGSGNALEGIGGSALWGGAGGGGGHITTDPGANGGASTHGGDGSAGETGATSASAASAPGGGGGGTETGNSGAGGDGRVEVYVF